MAGYWTHFSHGADIGVCGIGPVPAEAFAQAALALIAVISEPEKVAAQEAVEIECQAPDLEFLLYDWLNALICEMATRKMLFGRFEIVIEQNRLRATLWGEPANQARHQPAVEVKGATYTELAVFQREDGQWQAQCVVDV
jgi:SHS2 domain-containing protein